MIVGKGSLWAFIPFSIVRVSMSTTMGEIVCPHCNAGGQTPGGFCTACGKALPTASASGPRVLGQNEFGATGAGRSLRSNELVAQSKKAAGALIAVAIMQGVFGAILIAASTANVPVEHSALVMAYTINTGVALIFLALFFWARKSPLPAAIVGLVIFITMHLLSAILDPTQIIRGIIFKIIIVVVLVKAIQAGLQYRKIQQEAGIQ
jgi:hypothetical protein